MADRRGEMETVTYFIFLGSKILWTMTASTKLRHSDAGRDWGQEEKGMTEDEMAGWHH